MPDVDDFVAAVPKSKIADYKKLARKAGKVWREHGASGKSIQAVQTFECADDAGVILKAAALLDAKPELQNVEIWDGNRMVARVPRRERSSPQDRSPLVS